MSQRVEACAQQADRATQFLAELAEDAAHDPERYADDVAPAALARAGAAFEPDLPGCVAKRVRTEACRAKDTQLDQLWAHAEQDFLYTHPWTWEASYDDEIEKAMSYWPPRSPAPANNARSKREWITAQQTRHAKLKQRAKAGDQAAKTAWEAERAALLSVERARLLRERPWEDEKSGYLWFQIPKVTSEVAALRKVQQAYFEHCRNASLSLTELVGTPAFNAKLAEELHRRVVAAALQSAPELPRLVGYPVLEVPLDCGRDKVFPAKCRFAFDTAGEVTCTVDARVLVLWPAYRAALLGRNGTNLRRAADRAKEAARRDPAALPERFHSVEEKLARQRDAQARDAADSAAYDAAVAAFTWFKADDFDGYSWCVRHADFNARGEGVSRAEHLDRFRTVRWPAERSGRALASAQRAAEPDDGERRGKKRKAS